MCAGAVVPLPLLAMGHLGLRHSCDSCGSHFSSEVNWNGVTHDQSAQTKSIEAKMQ